MIHLITGGSGSGKSAYGESQIEALGDGERIYIATMFPFDQESHRRIARHREMRKGKKFRTIEQYLDLDRLKVEAGSHILLECMSNLTANEIYQEGGGGKDSFQKILTGIKSLASQAEDLVIISNEVFSDGLSYDEETLFYLETLGRLNEALGQMADQVTEVVCGIPIPWKRGQCYG